MKPKEKSGKPDTTYLIEYAPELALICHALSFGEVKYSRDNWKNVSIDDFRASAIRHVLGMGVSDVGSHEVQAIVNLLIILRKNRLANSEGFEPSTYCLEGSCSIR